MVLLAFFVVFSIAGTQLLMGILKKRCINIVTGVALDDDPVEPLLCGGRTGCPEGYFCGK